LGTAIDVTRALDWLAQENRGRSVKERILFAAVLLRAVALALEDVAELNGFWIDGRFRHADTYTPRRRHRVAWRRFDSARHPGCAAQIGAGADVRDCPI
jgi:hypothetical protein